MIRTIRDALDFASLWLFLYEHERCALLCQVRDELINDLRAEGIRTDGPDVGIFVGHYCIQRPAIVLPVLHIANRKWDCCRSLYDVMPAEDVKRWLRERRSRCSFVINSLSSGRKVELWVKRLYRGPIVVEYIHGIAPLYPAAQRLFTPTAIHPIRGAMW